MGLRDVVLDSTGATIGWARDTLDLTYEDIGRTVGASRRSVSRWVHREAVPSRRHRQRMERLRVLRHLVHDLFEDEEQALEWFHSSVPMLRGRTPISLLEEGKIDEVVGVLAGLQSGAHY